MIMIYILHLGVQTFQDRKSEQNLTRYYETIMWLTIEIVILDWLLGYVDSGCAIKKNIQSEWPKNEPRNQAIQKY